MLFINARVVDGTGAPWFAADVRGGKIAAVGRLSGAPARRTINAAGLVLAPGFIDLLGQSEYTVLVDPRAASKITQGITTEVTGEGESIAPLDPLSHETSHPRGWGSAARILGHYVREEKLLRLEEAIRKMTSFAAEAAGLPDRGLVKPGLAADLAVFDPETVRSGATFENPNRYSEGFRYVAVNGVLVLDDGRLTGKTPGWALRGPGYEKKSKVEDRRSKV